MWLTLWQRRKNIQNVFMLLKKKVNYRKKHDIHIVLKTKWEKMIMFEVMKCQHLEKGHNTIIWSLIGRLWAVGY